MSNPLIAGWVASLGGLWVAVLGGLLVLFLGVLVGTSWAEQALAGRYRRQAIERRELNELRYALQKAHLGCAWCGSAAALPAAAGSGAGGRARAARFSGVSAVGAVHPGGGRY